MSALNFPAGASMCLVATTSAKTINLPTPDTGRFVYIVDSTGGANQFPITVSTTGTGVAICNGFSTIVQPFGTLGFLANNNNWYAIINESGVNNLRTLITSNLSAAVISTNYGFFSTISTGSIYGRHIGDGSLLTGIANAIPPVLSTNLMSSGIITGNLISTATLSTTFGYISSLTVDSLSFGAANGFINMGDVITTSISSIQTFTSSLLTTNLQVGVVSSLSYIAFPGLQQGYNQTILAEQGTGTGTQELLLFRGSTATDRIRMQTTGSIVFEPGVGARLFPAVSSNVTPAMIINTSSNVGIGTATPGVTLDVVGAGRFTAISTNTISTTQLNSGNICNVGWFSNNGVLSNTTAGAFFQATSNSTTLGVAGVATFASNITQTAGTTTLISTNTTSISNSGVISTQGLNVGNLSSINISTLSLAAGSISTITLGAGSAYITNLFVGTEDFGSALTASSNITQTGGTTTLAGLSVNTISTNQVNSSNICNAGWFSNNGVLSNTTAGAFFQATSNTTTLGVAGVATFASNITQTAGTTTLISTNTTSISNSGVISTQGLNVGNLSSINISTLSLAAGSISTITLGAASAYITNLFVGTEDFGSALTASSNITQTGGTTTLAGLSVNTISTNQVNSSNICNAGWFSNNGALSNTTAGAFFQATSNTTTLGVAGVATFASNITQTAGTTTLISTNTTSISNSGVISTQGLNVGNLSSINISTLSLAAGSISTITLGAGSAYITNLFVGTEDFGSALTASSNITQTGGTTTLAGLSVNTISTNFIVARNISTTTLSTSYGFFSTISTGSVYGKFIGDGSALTGLPAAGVGVTSTLSTLVFLTSSISSANITSAQGYISSLIVDSLSFGLSNSYISMGDVITTSISSIQTFTSSLITNNLQVGTVSSLSFISFPGLQQGYTQSILAEVSTGTGLQEMLVFRGSSASDRIRMQTTGSIVFEPGVSARMFPAVPSNVTPAMIINTSSNVGIGIAAPTTTLDVAGTGRFQILSTQQMFVSSISSGIVYGRFIGDGSGLTGVSGGGGGAAVSTFTTIGVQFSTVSLSSLFLMRTGVSTVSFGTNTSSLAQVYIGDLKNQLNFSTARDATFLLEQQLPLSNTIVSTFLSNGLFTVPQNVNFLNVHMWGAGGSNGGGGGGAYISGTLPVSSGSILTIAVNTGFGNSGNAAGGGYAGIFLSTIAVNNILAIAGGGGASGSRASDSGGFGGVLQGGSGGYGGVGQGGPVGGGQTCNTGFFAWQLQGETQNSGGGGGFWGGQGGTNNSVVVVGGGGGSSYISNLLNFYGENGTSAITGGVGGGKGTPYNNGTYGDAANKGAVVLVWSPGLRRANLMTIQDACSRRLIVSESLYMGINVSTPNSNFSLEVVGMASLSSIIATNISTTSLTVPYGTINAAAATSSLGVFGMRTISNGQQIAFGTTGALGSVTPYGPVGKNSQIYINDVKNYLGNVSTSDAVLLIEQDMSLLSNTNVRVVQISTSVGYTVPAGVTAIRAFMWGSGGNNWPGGGAGGAGAFIAGTFNTNPGEILSTVINYGGGGGSITGGGFSGIFRGAITQGNAIGIAAGGGAGSSHPVGGGGFGGVINGGPAYYRWGATGGGGTQTAGGGNGTALQGGSSTAGGGGGYFGGAGNGNNSVDVVSGGGGSSYIAGLFNVLAEDGRVGNYAANNLAGGQWAPFSSNWGNPGISGRIFLVYNTRVRTTNLLELRTGYTSSITAITNYNTMGINVSSVLSTITLDVGGQGRFLTLSSQQLFVSSISSGNLFGRFIGDGSLLTGVSVTLPTTLAALIVSTGFLTASNISATTISTSYGFFSTISSGTIYGQHIGDGSLLTNISNTGAVLTISNSLVTTSNNLTTVSTTVATNITNITTLSNLLNSVSTNTTTISTNLDTVSNLLNSVSTNATTISTNLNTVSNSVGTNATNITTISNLLNAVSTSATTISTNLNTVSNLLNAVSTNATTISTNLDTVSNSGATNATNITTISNLLNSVSTSATTISTNLNTVSNSVGTNATNITTISNLLNSVSTSATTISTNLNTVSNSVGTNTANITYLLSVSNYSAITLSTSYGFFSTISAGTVYGKHIGDGSGLTGLPASGLSIIPPVLSTTILSTGFLSASNISSFSMSTVYGFFSTISTGTVFGRHIGDGSGLTGITVTSTFTTVNTTSLTVTSGAGTINFTGGSNTSAYGTGVDTLSLRSQLAAYGGGIASLFFGNATAGYPLARIYAVDSVAAAPGASALVFQTAVSSLNAGLSGLNIFTYSGSDQSYTVPSGVSSVTISMWGAGGGPGQAGGFGGGGAYVNGTLAVTAGMSLRIIVGQGGSGGATGSYGGGGFGNGSSSGGGRSAIQLIQTGIVTGASASGGTITYTTSLAHRLQAGQGFIVSNLASGSVFNLTGIVASVLSATSFTLTNATTGTTVTGGTGTLTIELVNVGGGGGGPNCGGGAFSGNAGLVTGQSGSAEAVVTGGSQTAAGSGGGGSAGYTISGWWSRCW
jgi:trimeric autotransporter adhesin